jgi:uncharacterized protein YdhG (YjbR/CyaY superfamily)
MSIIDSMLKDVPAPQRNELERIRSIIIKECPAAEEVITYGMSGYKYKGKYLLSFANFADHMSIFPGAEPIDALAEELKPYRTSKGTIQFTLENNLSDELVKKIAILCKQRIDS